MLATAAWSQPDGASTDGDYAPWAQDDPDRWPRIAMVNRIRYSDSFHPMAGSAFLLNNGQEIVAVTAKHVLRFFKSDAMDSVSFQGTLVSWEMFPKDEPTDVTVIGALINENSDESLDEINADRDWLLLTVQQGPGNVESLRFRSTPLKIDEAVFVVGWRYTDEGAQHVYAGRYLRSEEGSILIDVPELTDNRVPGLSGAPVLDAQGYVIGIMSSKSGRLQRLGSIDYPRQVLTGESRPTTLLAGAAGNDTNACAQEMTAHFSRNGWIGITPEIDALGTITVAAVFADSPAQKGGIRQGDIILGINGIPRDGDPAAFSSAYASLRPGTSSVFDLARGGERLSVEIRVEPIPKDVLEQWIRQECH
jgi:hypothetical protein